MLRPRIIASLLIYRGGLVKTRQFMPYKYLGDPLNAVRIFNEKQADELVIWDIDASLSRSEPNYSLISKLANEAQMPLCYGGGISTLDQAAKIIDLGVEKISLSTYAIQRAGFISLLANRIGKQSVVGVIDSHRVKVAGGFSHQVFVKNENQPSSIDSIKYALELQNAGVGEVIVNTVDRDGEMSGYDLDLAYKMKSALSVPLTVLGGAGSLEDIRGIFRLCGIIGAAAGSLFVFKGKNRAVLITYPSQDEIEDLSKAAII